MAATIKIKNSSTASAVPTSSDLVQGELAVNVTDKRIFTENASGTVVELCTNPSILTLPDGSASAPTLTNDGDTNTGIFFPAADTVGISTGGTERARVDSSGNLGLGVTPSAWTTYTTNFQNTSASIASNGVATTVFGTNWYYDGQNRYRGTGLAALYFQTAGQHAWFTAASGTAGNILSSLTQAMTLDASGNLGVGTTSPVSPLTAARGNVTGAGQWASSAIAVYNPTNIGSYSQIAFGYTSGTTNAAAYIGFVSTNQGSNGYGDLVFGTRSVNTDTQPTERARIDSSGNLLVGTTNNDPTFNRVNGNVIRSGGGLLIRSAAGATDWGLSVTSGIHVYFYSDNGSSRVVAGNISSNGSTTSYNASSDYRMKENVAPMQDALSKVARLKPCTYTWKTEFAGTNPNGEGFIAHELAEVVPQCVTGERDAVDADGNPIYQGIDTSFLVATLTAAIQELKAEVDNLKAQIAGA